MQVAVEHPPAAVEPRRQDAAEEAGVAHLAQLGKAREIDLVLHRGGLETRCLRGAHDLHRLSGRIRDRLLQIDVLAGRDRAQRALEPPAGGRHVEIDVDRRVGEGRCRIGRPRETAMGRRERRQLVRIAAEQHRLGDEAVAVAQRQPAFLADRQHGADQVLVGAEASGDAVHRDAQRSCGHGKSRLVVRRGGATRRDDASPCACRA